MQHGCDGFEFDVRLTGDDQALVCHNATSRGLSLAKTDAERLRHLPLLADVISRFGKCAFLNIEAKVAGLEQHVLSELRDFPPQRGYVVSSFLPSVLLALRVRSETIPLGLVFQEKASPWRELPINYIMPNRRLVTQKLVHEAHEAGKHIMTWTVNDKRSMLRFAEWGVDGIISDKTNLLVKTLRPQRA